MQITMSCRLLFAGLFFLLLPLPYVYANEIVFAYAGADDHPAYAGVELGLTEANLQGQFLGQQYKLVTLQDITGSSTRQETAIAILAALDKDELLLLREAYPFLPIMNLAARDDSLRSQCHGNILSVIPAKAMLEDASQQWRQKHPESQPDVVAWHEDFVKFAARDLNKRYLKVFNKGMDDYAWAGWAAVRMIADTIARESIDNPALLLKHLKTNLSFDGQKGIDMNFRETGQLRQPLLIVIDGMLAGEAPVRGVSDDIDSLGTRECTK